MRTVIYGGTVVRHDSVFRADVAMENGLILEVGENLPRDGAEAVDASGCYVLPGGVDVHTHFTLNMASQPPEEHCFRVGSQAAALGGTTCVVEHPALGSDEAGLLDQPAAVRNLAEGRSVVDYGVHTVLQPHSDLAQVAQAAAEGYVSGKIYRTYAAALDDQNALQALVAMRAARCLTAVHCENDAMVQFLTAQCKQGDEKGAQAHPRSRPPLCEEVSIFTMLALAKVAEATLYVAHLSTAEGLAHIKAARAAGQSVLVETCPQYLVLDETVYGEGAAEGLKYVMSPPLREARHGLALWQALREGHVDVVATDHCPFSYADKWRLSGGDVFRCPGGAPGVETRVPLMFSEGVLKGRLTLPRFVQVVAEAPARYMGLPRKGVLEAGFDADVLVLDPAVERVITAADLHEGMDYTPFEGLVVRGWPRHVWLRGQWLVREHALVALAGCGQFVSRTFV